MSNFSCKKLSVESHLDYSACIAHDTNCNPLKMRIEMHQHFANIRSKVNAEKYVVVLLALWTEFVERTGPYKKNIVGAAMFYADHWTFKQQLAVYHCLLLISFPLYRDVMQAIVQQGMGLFVAKNIEEHLNKLGYNLSAATVSDYTAQIFATMLELGVIKRYRFGTFIKSNVAVLDDVGVYSILQVAAALKANSEDQSWLWNCYNFEITREFVDFFNEIDYASIIGAEVWKEFNEGNFHSMQLNKGEWCCSNGEFVYDNGRRKIEYRRNSFVDVADLKTAYGNEVFNGWDC